MKKFQSGGKFKIDYFQSSLNGQLQGNPEDKVKQAGANDVELADRLTQWSTPGVKEKYEEHFGAEAYDMFNKEYDVLQKEYNQFQSLKLNKNKKDFVDEHINIAGNKWNTEAFISTIDKGLEGQRVLLSGDVTKKEKDIRQAILDNGYWKDDQGELHKFTDEQKSLFDSGDVEDNELFKSKDGRKIKGFVYENPEELKRLYGDEHDIIRNKGYLKALYYGDEQKNDEVVSTWDFTGLTKIKQEGNIYSAIPRAIMGTFGGIVAGIGAIGESTADLINLDSDNAFRQWSEARNLRGQSMGVSKSSESKDNIMSSENVSSLISDVALQLLSGRAFATAGGKIASLAGGSIDTIKKTSKLSSIVPLTVIATSDARNQAKAAGFSDDEAALFQGAMLLGMFGINKAFSWVDETTDLVREGNKLNKIINDKIAYTADLVKNASSDAEKAAIKEKGLKGLTNTVKDFITNGTNKISNVAKTVYNSEVTGNLVKEGLEETGETWTEYGLKGLWNIYSEESGQKKNKHFLSSEDPNYWKQFWIESGMSAVGGIMGAGMSQGAIKAGQMFFNQARTEDNKNRLVDIILKGEGKKYLDAVDNMHSKGLLGSTSLSTTYDDQNNSFLSIESAGPNATNHNDANHKLILNEFNSITSLISGIGSTGVQKLVDENPSYKDGDIAGEAISNVRKLTSEYLKIKTSNPSLADAEILVPENVDKNDEKYKTYIKELANNYKVNEDDISRLIDIKQEISDINSGKYTQKFLLKKLLKDSVFNGKNEDFKKYGDKFLDNLLEAIDVDNKYQKEQIQLKKDNMKENALHIDAIKPDLSNIKELKEIIDSGKIKELSVSSKNKLKTIVKGFELDPVKFNSIKYIINKTTKDIYNKRSKELVSAIIENNPSLNIDKVNDFVNSFYQTILENKLNKVQTSDDFENLKLPNIEENIHVDDILEAIDDLEDTGSVIEGSVADVINNNDPKLLGTTLGNIVADNENFDNYISHFNPVQQLAAVKFEYEKAYQPVIDAMELIKSIENITDERHLNENPFDFSFLKKEFSGNEKGISIGADLSDRISGVKTEYENSIVNGVSYFDNVEETKSLLNQLIVKRDLLNGLRKYSETLTKYNTVLDRIVFNPKNKKSVELFNEKISNADRVKFSKTFKDLFYDPLMLRYLRKNDLEGTLATDQNNLYSYLTNIQNGLAQVRSDVNNDIKLLSNLLKTAEANQNTENIISLKKKAINDQIKFSVESLYEFITLNGLDLTDNSTIKEFIDYYFKTYGNGKRTEDALLEDQKYTYKIYDYLREQSDDNKIKWLDNYYKNGLDGNFIYGSLSSGIDNVQQKTRNKLGDFNRIAIASFLDIREFNQAYKNILGNDISSIPSAEQEEVALAVIAHMNSDIATKLQPIINFNEENSRLNDTLVVLGTAGAGKSTFALGYGILIGQQLQNKRTNKKYKVLLGSNNQDQIKTITETCNNFKFGNSKIEVKTIPGKNGGTGVQVNDLIAILELASKGDKFLNDVSTIAYDEATMISYFIRGDRESELGKILNLIEKINLNRDKKGEEKLKLLLLGDSQQNGVIIGDESANIGVSSNNAFRTKYLNFNYRAKVSAITESAGTIKHLGATKPLTDITTTYGYIQKQNTPKLGGVRFVNQEFDAFNNDELIDNIKNLINTNKNKLKPELFKIAIVSNKELPDSKLKLLMDDINYKDNIKIFTHETVQGNEVDYVIAVMDQETFKNSKSEWQTDNVLNESIVSKKLATTIERARYFALIVNETQRNFISEESKTISITESILPEDAVKNVKDYRLKVLNNEEPKEVIKQEVNNDKLNTIDNTNTNVTTAEDKGEHTTEDKENKNQDQLSDKKEEEDLEKENVVEIVKDENKLVEKPIEVLNKEAELSEDINEKAEINAAIIAKTIDEQETGIVINDEEESNFSKGIEEIVTEGKLDKNDVAKMFHLQKGILTAYPTWRTYGYDEISKENKIKNLFINANLANQQDYESIQIKAINELRNNGSNFNYKIISRKDKLNRIHFMITAESEGKGVVLATVFLPYTDGAKSPFNTRLRDLLESNNNLDRKLTKAELNNILSHITNGGLNSLKNNKVTLSELRKKLVNTPGLKLSKHIFVTTKADSENRGDAFIFYTFNDKIDLESDEMIKKFMSEAPKLIEFKFDNNGKPFNIGMFANGVGVLRLDTRPIKFSDFFKQSINLSINGDYSLVNMVLQNKASLQIAGLFASSRRILGDKFNIGSNLDLSVSNLEKEKDYQDSLSDTSYIKIETLLTELVNKNDETSDKLLKFIVSATNNLGQRSQTSSKDIISWSNSKKGLIGYAEAEEDKKRLILFNTNKLLEFINSDFNDSEKEYVLNFFDRLLGVSDKFKNGLYIRPNAVKNDYNNKVFARLEDINSIDLENVFETNISSIDLPSLRLNIEAINKFITKPIVEETIKEITTHSKEYIDINAKLDALKTNENIDLDFELSEIRELIDNNLDKLSSKEKELLEINFSLLESMTTSETNELKEINLDDFEKELLEQVIRVTPFSFSVEQVNDIIKEAQEVINSHTINNLGKVDYNLVAKVNSIINKIKNQIVDSEVIKASIIENLNSTIQKIPNLRQEIIVYSGHDKYSFYNTGVDEINIIKNDTEKPGDIELKIALENGILSTSIPELSDKLIAYHFFKNLGSTNISDQIKSDISKTYLEDNKVKESTFTQVFNDVTNPTNSVKAILAKLHNLPELTAEQENSLKESIDVLREIQEHKNEIVTGTYTIKSKVELNRTKSLADIQYKYDKGTDLDIYTAKVFDNDGQEKTLSSFGLEAFSDINNQVSKFYDEQNRNYKDKSNIKLGEFFTAGDVEDIIKYNSNTNESLDENIGEAGEKILDSTWGVVKNILSLPLSNKLEIDRVLNSDTDLNKMKRAVEQILLFVEDEDKKNRIMEETKSLEDQLVTKKTEAMENSKVIDGIDTTIASEANFVPYLKGKNTSPLSEKATSVLLKFKENQDIKLKEFYIQFLNGAWATNNDKLGLVKYTTKLFSIIKSIASDEKTFKEVIDYITEKSKESSCQ